MATSTPKKDSRDSALNVHKFYGHQRHIDRSLHPVNQSVENFNDRDHRQIDGDHLATTVAETVDCWGFTIGLAIADLVLTPGASGTEQTLASTTAAVPVSLASVDLSS